MKKPKRKSRKPRNRNKNSMLEREEYALGSIVRKGLSLLGANLDDAVTRTGQPSRGVRRRPTDEDKAIVSDANIEYETRKQGRKEFLADAEKNMTVEDFDAVVKADELNPVVPPTRRDASKNTGSIYAIMGDDALRIKGNIDKYKGAGILATAQVALIASYLVAQNLLDEDPEDGKTALEKTPEEAKNIIAKNAIEATKEGSAFEIAFSNAFNKNKLTFEFEGKTYTTDVLEPSERVQKQEGGEMAVPPEMEAMQATPEMMEEEVPVDTYPNATPEELEAADQKSDTEMEEGYMEFILNESLNPEEQTYLMNSLEADPQLSIIFDKVVEVASEFSGAGEVTGPGDGLSDSIPARLSDGEFVMTKKATDQLGADNLQTMMDEAEQAYDGGLMRQNRYLGGEIKNDEDEMLGQGKGTDDDIRKLMSIKANKTPSLR